MLLTFQFHGWHCRHASYAMLWSGIHDIESLVFSQYTHKLLGNYNKLLLQ